MPKSPRDEILRKIDQIQKALDKILYYTHVIREYYPKDYEDQNEWMTVFGETIISLKDNLDWYKENLS